MCDFGIGESIALAISVASTAASLATAKQQADAQTKYQNEMYEQTGQSARDNFFQQTGVAGQRMQQNAQSAGAQSYQNQLQSAQAIGHAQAAAAEAGVGGNSVAALFNEFSNIGAQNQDATTTNLQFQNEQLVQDERSLRSQAQSRINGALPGPVQQPSYLGAALQIGSSIYGAYDKHSYATQTGFYDPQRYRAPLNIPYNGAGGQPKWNITSG